MQYSYIMYKDQSVSNTMVFTKQNTTVSLPGAARQTSKLTPQGSKQSKATHTLTSSNV